jgi:hypothetical protein
MDVIRFLCVSLSRSTVQLHASLGSRRACTCSEDGFSSQNGDRAAEDQRSVVHFLWEKGLNSKDIHKEIFTVYCGKCLPCKAFHNWVEKRGKRFAHDEEVEAEVRKWLLQQSIDFSAAGFDTLVKRWDSVSVFVEDMSRNTCFSFPVSNITCLSLISICDLFIDSPSYDLTSYRSLGSLSGSFLFSECFLYHMNS